MAGNYPICLAGWRGNYWNTTVGAGFGANACCPHNEARTPPNAYFHTAWVVSCHRRNTTKQKRQGPSIQSSQPRHFVAASTAFPLANERTNYSVHLSVRQTPTRAKQRNTPPQIRHFRAASLARRIVAPPETSVVPVGKKYTTGQTLRPRRT